MVSRAGVLASMAATAAQSSPQVIPPTCINAANGRTLEARYTAPDLPNISVFIEHSASDDEPDSMFLVECVSRQGLKIVLHGKYFDPYRPAEEYILDVVESDETFTLPQVSAGLRSIGFRAVPTRLPDGHCGCELPSMEWN
jgi:hypothetical protein